MAKRKYRVISRQNTLGRSTGTVFEADLAREGYSEDELIARGALERVAKSTKNEEGSGPERPPIAGVRGDAGESQK